MSIPTFWLSRLRLFRSLVRMDAVIVQRKLLPIWQARQLRRWTQNLIFDFDDAVFLRDSYAAKCLHDARRLQRFQATMAAADVVLAGNSYLAKEAAASGCPGMVEVIPTCLDPGAYTVALHQRTGGGVQLVWIGSGSTLQGLELIRPMLESFGVRWKGLKLKLICDRFLRFLNLTAIDCPWSERTEARDLASADIGISWLPDDLWSHGKCGLKILQYMSAGLPVVANPVGVQAQMIRDGETGFLVRTPAEWMEAIGRLVQDPGLRQRMGQAGRRRVEREFSTEVAASRWLDLLSGSTRRRQAA
jgi:glycosyltransferase involved in cell wall biosynthesis